MDEKRPGFGGIGSIPVDPLHLVRTLFDDAPAALVVIDRDYRIRASNQFAQRLVGRAADELTGRQCYRAFHGDDAPCPDCPSTVAFRTGEVARTSKAAPGAEGATTYASLTALPCAPVRS